MLSRCNLILAGLGAVLLTFVCFAVVSEVVSRTLFGISGLWIIEVSEYSLLYLTFLACPYLLEHRQHVVMDILAVNLSVRWRRRVTVFVALVSAAVCLYVAYAGWLTAVDQFQMGFRESTTLAPYSFWLTAIMPISLVLVALQFLMQTYDCLFVEPA